MDWMDKEDARQRMGYIPPPHAYCPTLVLTRSRFHTRRTWLCCKLWRLWSGSTCSSFIPFIAKLECWELRLVDEAYFNVHQLPQDLCRTCQHTSTQARGSDVTAYFCRLE